MALCLCSCVGESHSFSTSAQFKASEEYERWGPDIIPDGAEEIETWHDIDSNLVRTEFFYRGPRPVVVSGLEVLAPELKSAAVEAFPALGDGAHITSIQYRCQRKVIELDPSTKESVTFSQVEFVGDSGEKMYYWNTHLDATYDRLCQGPNASASGNS